MWSTPGRGGRSYTAVHLPVASLGPASSILGRGQVRVETGPVAPGLQSDGVQVPAGLRAGVWANRKSLG